MEQINFDKVSGGHRLNEYGVDYCPTCGRQKTAYINDYTSNTRLWQCPNCGNMLAHLENNQ